MQTFTAVVEYCDQTFSYVGYVPGLQGAHTQGETLDELRMHLKEVLELLSETGELRNNNGLVGTLSISV